MRGERPCDRSLARCSGAVNRNDHRDDPMAEILRCTIKEGSFGMPIALTGPLCFCNPFTPPRNIDGKQAVRRLTWTILG
jgi:hypothetical protein